MPKPSETDPTKNLVALCEALFGPQWVNRLARLTGVNTRTLDRLYGAAKRGEPSPHALGVLKALAHGLRASLDDTEAAIRRADDTAARPGGTARDGRSSANG